MKINFIWVTLSLEIIYFSVSNFNTNPIKFYSFIVIKIIQKKIYSYIIILDRRR